MVSSKRIGLGFLIAALAAACGSKGGDSSSPPPPPTEPLLTAWPSMSGMVDASGGTLTGAKGTVFEGLVLVIPPGALAAPTNVTITQSEDTTPLPPGARRIGTQFTIGPSDAVLAKPASLSLPAEPSEVESYFSQASDMKVWRLESGAWTRSEPTATVDGLVTIDLPDFTTVGPGVKITTVGLNCGSNCIPPSLNLNPCNTGIGYCLRDFGPLSPAPEDSSAGYVVDGGFLYWIAPSASGTQVYRTVLATTGFQDQYKSASGPVFGVASTRTNPAVNSFGNTGQAYFIGVGADELAVGFDGHPNLMIPEYGRGAVSTDTTFAWFANTNATQLAPSYAFSQYWDGLSYASYTTGLHFIAPHEVANTGEMVTFWGRENPATTFVIGQIDIAASFGRDATYSDWFIQPPGIIYGADVDRDGSVGVLMRDVGAPINQNYLALYKKQSTVAHAVETRMGTLSLPDGALISQFSFDGLGGIWFAEANAPLLWYHAPTGDFRGPYQLSTSTNPTDPDYIQHLVIRMLRETDDSDGRILVVTYGKTVMVVNDGNGS